MKALVVGAGAIGGSLAVYLSRAGFSVTVLEKNAETCQILREKGLTLKEPGGRVLHARPEIAESTQGIKGSFPLIFSATRAYHLKAAAQSVLPFLAEGGFVVAMNNGVCLDLLIQAVGAERAAACAIDYGAGISAPGSYYIKIPGGVRIGTQSKRAPGLKKMLPDLNKALPVVWAKDILAALYSKMLINACITSSAILTGLPLGEILAMREGKRLFTAIITEGMALAKDMRMRVPAYKGYLSYGLFVGCPAYRALLFYVLRKKYAGRTSATLASMQQGAKSETEFYNGYIAQKAEERGLQAPVNRAVWESICQIEEEGLALGPENLARCLP